MEQDKLSSPKILSRLYRISVLKPKYYTRIKYKPVAPAQVEKHFAFPDFLDQAVKLPSQQKRLHYCREGQEN